MSRDSHNDIIVRPAVADDMKFIMSSWKQSWRVSPWAGTVRNDDYFKVIDSTIEGLVARGTVFEVACLEKYQGRILGWLCYEILSDGLCCVHYTYTKDPYLRMGIGAVLVGGAKGTKPGLYTHRFSQVVEACPGWRHAPEVARRK